MKQTKQKILVCCLTIMAVLCPILFILSGCFSICTIEDAAQRLADKFEIQLPEDAKLLYCLHCSDWTDGEDFYVISFEETPAELIEYFSYQSDDSIMDSFNAILAHMSEEEKKEIPTEYYPDSETEYCWKEVKNSYGWLYLFYYPESLELYVMLFYY